jgi:hypothetical protein
MILLPKIARDGDLVRQLESWRDLFQRLTVPFLTRGVLLRVQLPAGTSQVNHGLRANPRGWLVLRIEANAPVSIAEVQSTDLTLTLTLSAPATLTLWVY